LLKIAGGAVLLLALASGAILFAFSNPAEALAWFRGEGIAPDPAVYDIGKGSRGEERTFRVQLTNRTKRDIRLVGGTTICSCITTKDLPLSVAPRSQGSMSVT
jgi:hypothetical protein